jgi:hypothetical protein
VIFANAVLLGGLGAAALPVLVHLAHRRKYKRQTWGAMRWLQQTIVQRKRRLALDHLLLLAVRTLALACLALALCRPQTQVSGGGGTGGRIVRDAGVAAVVVIDDSLAAAAPRSAPAIKGMRALAHAYLDTLKPGDEVTVVALSKLGEPAGDPLYDLAAAHAAVDQVVPTAVAGDVPALLEAGLDRFARNLNPEAELVLVSPGRSEGWHADDRARWTRLRARLGEGAPGGAGNFPGSHAHPHLVLLAPASDGPVPANWSVDAVTVDRTVVGAGRPVAVHVTIGASGAARTSGAGMRVRLAVDGRTVAEQALGGGGGSGGGGGGGGAEQRELIFDHAFATAGSHLVEALLVDPRDALAEDDRRALALEVEERIAVLLVEGHPGQGLGGTLGAFAAALDPGGGDQLFALDRVGPSKLDEQALAGHRVAVLGDVPALDAAAIAALERFVASGGGVLAVTGKDTDPALVGRWWVRGGDGFFPAALNPASDCAPPLHPHAVARAHPALAPFTWDQGSEAWRHITVARRYTLDHPPADLERLLDLDDGSPLLVARARGHGEVALLTTALDGSWSDLPFRGSFVPLARSLVGWLGGGVLPPRNLSAGERLAWFPPDGPLPDLAQASATGPDGQPVPLAPSAWEDHPALVSAPLVQPGAYAVHTPGRTTWFEVGTDPAASRLEPLDRGTLDAALAQLPHHDAASPVEVTELFASAAARHREWWQALVVASALLLLLETIITRAQVVGERRAAGGSPGLRAGPGAARGAAA